jgi:plastocyanin
VTTSRRHLLTVSLLVPLVLLAGCGGDGAGASTIRVSDADDVTVFDYDYVIPPGTADRIAAGDDIEIIPQELVMEVGQSIRITNHDDVGHVVGVFYVGAGETLTQRFDSPGELSGECTVHPSGSFTLRVVET